VRNLKAVRKRVERSVEKGDAKALAAQMLDLLDVVEQHQLRLQQLEQLVQRLQQHVLTGYGDPT
jgi:molecular chaperone GrpE (heat shock protein)